MKTTGHFINKNLSSVYILLTLGGKFNGLLSFQKNCTQNIFYTDALMLLEEDPLFSIQYHLSAYQKITKPNIFSSGMRVLISNIQTPYSAALGAGYSQYLSELFSTIEPNIYLNDIDRQIFILMSLKNLGFDEKYTNFFHHLANVLYLAIENGGAKIPATFLGLYQNKVINEKAVLLALGTRKEILGSVSLAEGTKNNFNLFNQHIYYRIKTSLPIYEMNEQGKLIPQERTRFGECSTSLWKNHRISLSASTRSAHLDGSASSRRLIRSEELSPRENEGNFIPPLTLSPAATSFFYTKLDLSLTRTNNLFEDSSVQEKDCKDEKSDNWPLFSNHQRRSSDPLPTSHENTSIYQNSLSPIIEVNTPTDSQANKTSVTADSTDPRLLFHNYLSQTKQTSEAFMETDNRTESGMKK